MPTLKAPSISLNVYKVTVTYEHLTLTTLLLLVNNTQVYMSDNMNQDEIFTLHRLSATGFELIDDAGEIQKVKREALLLKETLSAIDLPNKSLYYCDVSYEDIERIRQHEDGVYGLFEHLARLIKKHCFCPLF